MVLLCGHATGYHETKRFLFPSTAMGTTNTIEERVASLERELSALKSIVHGAKQAKDWRTTFGMSQDDPGFAEMIGLGREYRAAQQEGDSPDASAGHGSSG
jgi:hypothetical protein